MVPTEAFLEEEEILQSIYPEELERVSDDTLRIALSIDPADLSYPRPPAIVFQATLPPGYPDEIPALEVTLARPPVEYVDDEDDLRKSDADKRELAPDGVTLLDGEDRSLLELSERDEEAVVARLSEIAAENIGMPMLFTLASACQEEVVAVCAQKWDRVEARRKEARDAVERIERRRAEGTPLTREAFMAWRAKYLQDQKAKVAAASSSSAGHRSAAAQHQQLHSGLTATGARKKTGKELFEADKALAQSDLTGFDDDDEDIVQAGDAGVDTQRFGNSLKADG